MNAGITKKQSSKLDQTARVISAVLKSKDTPRITDALKPVKAILKSIGFTLHPENKKEQTIDADYTPVPIKGLGQGTSSELYSSSTIYDLLRSYRTSIKSLDIKHNTLGGRSCPISRFKKEYGSKLENMDSEVQELLKKFDPKTDLQELRIVKKQLSYAVRNRASAVSALKKVKLENQSYYWVLACMRLVSDEVNIKQSKSFEDSQNNKILINDKYVLNWAESILNSDTNDFHLLCLALMAVTGRRTTEILKTAIFTKTNNSNTVLFDGQLKQKDREALGNGAGSYVIPVLVDSELVIQSLKKLRKLTANETINFMINDGTYKQVKLLDPAYRMDVRHSEGVNDKYATALSNKIKRIFDSSIMRPYLFRSAYTEIAYNKGLSEKGEGIQAFRKRVLGHSNFLSQANYSKFGLSEQFKIIGLEAFGTNKKDKDNQSLIKLLDSKKDQIFSNTRAKGMHRLFEHTMALANANEVELSDITASWARAQIVDGKKIGASTVKQLLEILEIK